MNAKQAKEKSDTVNKQKLNNYIKNIDDSINNATLRGEYECRQVVTTGLAPDLMLHYKGHGYGVTRKENEYDLVLVFKWS